MTSTQQFNKRNESKKSIHQSNKSQYPTPREIWYVKLGINIGIEENGKDFFLRPVLVIKKIGNIFFCIPMTIQGKKNNIFYYKLKTSNTKKESYIITSQGRTLDTKRFERKIGKISQTEFIQIKKLLKEIYLGKAF